MARNDIYLNINSLSVADAVVTGQQDMTAATIPELVLGDTPTFNFYFTDNTNVWPSWAGNASYSLTWALSDAVSGDFAPAATTGNATPITGGWSVVLPLNSYDLVGLLNGKRIGQSYPVQNLWQQLRVTDPSGNEVTRAMVWTPVRYRAISDTQNTESASPTGGRFVTVNNVNTLTTPTAAQFYAANPVPTSALGTAANGELLIGNGTGFTKATLTAGSGVSITNGSGSITITATDGDITLDDGTAAAPSLKFTADTDTGLFRPSDNVVGISAGGVSRATFGATSAINGTSIPASKTLVVTTDKLSALASTSSSELAGVISDETGTGALVFANTPTLVTPNIGAATGTSVNLSGSGTFGGNLTVTGALLAHQTATLNLAHEGSSLSQAVAYGADASTYGRFNVVLRKAGTGVGAITALSVNSTDATLAGNLTVSGTGTSEFNGLVRITSGGFRSYGSMTLGTSYAAMGGGFQTSYDSPTTRIFYGDGTGFDLRFSTRASSTTTDRFTFSDSGNLTTSGNLTVSGTSPSTFAGPIVATGSTSALAANRAVVDYVAGTTTRLISYGPNASTAGAFQLVGLSSDASAGDIRLSISNTGNATLAGNLTVSGTGETSTLGYLRVGTNTGGSISQGNFNFGQLADNRTFRGSYQSATLARYEIVGADGNAENFTPLAVEGSSLVLNFRSGGNVLVGTTTDGGQKLQVNGTAIVSSTTASTSTTTGALVVSGGVGVAGAINVGTFYGMVDGVTAPSATSGYAKIYVDTADGDLKVIFGDGTIKTIATDS